MLPGSQAPIHLQVRQGTHRPHFPASAQQGGIGAPVRGTDACTPAGAGAEATARGGPTAQQPAALIKPGAEGVWAAALPASEGGWET